MNWVWSTNTEQYAQKVNIAITSDDIPDVMQVNASQLKMMYDNGQIMDVTEVDVYKRQSQWPAEEGSRRAKKVFLVNVLIIRLSPSGSQLIRTKSPVVGKDSSPV